MLLLLYAMCWIIINLGPSIFPIFSSLAKQLITFSIYIPHALHIYIGFWNVTSFLLIIHFSFTYLSACDKLSQSIFFSISCERFYGRLLDFNHLQLGLYTVVFACPTTNSINCCPCKLISQFTKIFTCSMIVKWLPAM